MKPFLAARSGRAPHRRLNGALRPSFETLEDRIVMAANPVLPQTEPSGVDSGTTVNTHPAAGIYYSAQTHKLNIYGTNLDDKAVVSTQVINSPDINTPPIVMTHVTLGHYEEVSGVETLVTTQAQLLPGGVSEIVFHGYGGDDEFRNMTSIASTAYGGEGNDVLAGGSGGDTLYGEGGDDVLVSIGGGQATLTGGAGNDSFWTSPGDIVADASTYETGNGHLHEVAEFMSYKFAGGPTIAVELELNGGDLADPLAIEAENSNPVLMNYADRPLFAAAGPTNTDVDQGGVGDCYYVATLAAIADANPDFIRQMVVDLGDGTYTVRFFRDGQEVYVRVDADLWTENGSLEYANFGADGSLWVTIVEKAYAFFRKLQGTYASIASGNGTLPNHLNLTRTTWTIEDGVTPEEVVAWHAAGSPAGALKDKIQAGVVNLLSWIKDRLAAGKALTTGARSSLGNNLGIQLDDLATEANESTYRRGQHVYMIHSVLTNAAGEPTGLKLYNPYGYNVTVTDFTRLYFCIGRAQAWDVDPNPGWNALPGDLTFEEATIPLPDGGDPFRLGQDNSTGRIDPVRSAVFDNLPPIGRATTPLARDASYRPTVRGLAPVDAAFERVGSSLGNVLASAL